MNRRTVLIALLGVIVILAGVGYYAVFREPEAPSAPIEAIPLEPEPTEEVAEAPESTEEPTEEVAEEPTEAPEPTDEPKATEEPTTEPEATEEPTAEPEPTDEVAEEPEVAASTSPITFEIASDQSSSRFELDEDLRGERITVVGTSDQVAAQLRLDPTDLSTAQVGTVLVNARAFVTDSNYRNRAIHNRILLTGEHEFITFEPTDLVGLPASTAVGETVNFDIIGNLTIRDITQQVTFATSVTAESESSLTGSASTVIQLVDYDLNIPEVPSVANVEEEVELYIDFVANALEAASAEAASETEEAAVAESSESEASEAEGEAEQAVEEAAEEASEEASEEPIEEVTEESVEEAADTPSAGAITFEIASDQSSSRFELDEDLRGERITVVGTSDQVAAQLRFDAADLSTAQVGTVLVNARAFTTDSDFRNRAIHNRILMTGEYEFITFEPTELVGLPASAAVGEPVNFDIIGNLTIRDITQQVTFATSLTAESESSLTGSASTVIQLADYDLNIPEVPSVANVEDEVELYIDFVANAIDGASPEAASETEEVAAAESSESEASEAEGEAEAAAEEAVMENTKLNLNIVTADELLNTIPDFGNRMVREFHEYRPYISILEFRREMGKYIDEAQIADYEQYVYVPVNVDESDAETLKQLPGVDDSIAAELIAARPYGSNDAFLAKLGEYLSPAEVGEAAEYLVTE